MNEAEHLACLGILKCKKELLMVSEPQQSSGLTEVGLVRASLETHALPGALDQEVTDQLAGRVPCRPTPQGSNASLFQIHRKVIYGIHLEDGGFASGLVLRLNPSSYHLNSCASAAINCSTEL